MLNGNEIVSHHGSDKEQEQMQDLSGLAFYPITFPMIVGPATIATLIIYASNASGVVGMMAIGGVVDVILAILFGVLFIASFFGKVFTDTIRVIMIRLMGMILLAISVEMIVAGAKTVLPGLA
ncbi:small neutral amino acid transporter SnatA (MarC family) [Sulfitobacter undariae]|uniref:UPF0056 membrane protein n=1 Tax=Sulfitobacter undariae TaxID=1563671 RepID=A0A7W6EC92_9RHOB|nr:MarC family protein [Sulfitobacter undariae]MBB3995548.1 small neutral amino acid transporter SnatA (MarC family) [Sulfitobacter undariae]